jgi:hypothetical protein
MFNCYLHGWSHIEQPCHLCHPVHTFSTSSTDIKIGEKSTAWNEIEELRAAAERLAEALDFVRCNLGIVESPPFPAPVAFAADKAREALAEYRAQFPKGEA